ncbi:hypothetical protein [Terriglobus sp. RCC_193]|uniref:hypothetical protein n=1 Tax=Terriglobus sp. RCC_193 TaxID=3239218 RepID=UPI0035236FDB
MAHQHSHKRACRQLPLLAISRLLVTNLQQFPEGRSRKLGHFANFMRVSENASRMLVRGLEVALVQTILGIALGLLKGDVQSDSVSAIAELDRVRPDLIHFLAVLPSLEAKESATSIHSLSGMPVREVRTTTEIRFMRSRSNAGEIASEHYKVSRDGNYVPISLFAVLPLSLTGEFDQMPKLLVSQEFSTCLDSKVVEHGTTIQLHLTSKAIVQAPNRCGIFGASFTCDLTIDAKSGHILRLTRRFGRETVLNSKAAVFLDIIYAPITIAGETMSLPSRIYAEDEKEDKFLATYSEWHRYKATSTVLVPDGGALQK